MGVNKRKNNNKKWERERKKKAEFSSTPQQCHYPAEGQSIKNNVWEKNWVKHYDRARKTRSKRGQERKGVQERGSKGNKWINSWGTKWKERWRGVEQKEGAWSHQCRFLLSGHWRSTQKHWEDSIKYHMQWPYCHGYGTVENINQACYKEKDGGK